MIRATFKLHLAGSAAEIERAVETLTEKLNEVHGLSYDEDFTTLYGAEWAITGIELRTRAAVLAGLELLDEVGAYLIETNEELVD